MIDHVFNKKDSEDQTDQDYGFPLEDLGTPKQTKVVSNYPSRTAEEKLKIPYIEKQNGNLCIQSVKD